MTWRQRGLQLDWGLEVTHSIGVLMRVVKVGFVSGVEELEAPERLMRVIWLSMGVYEDVRNGIEGL